MKKIRVFLLISALLLFLCGCFLCGCAQKAGVPEDSDPSGAAADTHYDFIFVCSLPENEYWKTCAEGMHKADAELGTSTVVTGPESADNFSVEIIDSMREAIDKEPDGIIAYAGIEGLYPLIEEATAKGIPVLAIDSDAPATSRVAYVGTDAYNAGYKAGQEMVQLTGGAIKVGVLVSSKSAEKEMLELTAFQDAVDDYDIEIVAIDETNAELEVAEAKTRKMLAAHPDIGAIFNTSNYNVTGAARVKKELGLDDLVLIGFDDVEENLRYVREGVIDAILVQRIEQAGRESVFLLKKYLDDGTLPEVIYDTGTIIVTQENINNYSSDHLDVHREAKTVRVGYYTGEKAFQDGFEEGDRKSGYAYEYYQAIAALTGWKYEYVYGTRTEIMDQLVKGEVDIVAGIYQTETRSEQMLFSVRDIGVTGQKRYFAVNKNRQDLLDDLNYAMEELYQNYSSFTVSLWQQYYSQTSKEQVLNDREKAWLAGLSELRIGYVRHNMPFSGQSKDGSPTGLIRDLTESFSSYLQIDIDPVCYDTISDMERGLITGEIDAAYPMYSDVWLAEAKGFRQTDAFISDRVMVVYRGNYTDDLLRTVALTNTGIGQRHYIAAYYPDAEIRFYESRKDVFDAIMKGEATCTVGCSSVLQRYMTEHAEYGNLNIAYLDTSENFGMAVLQDNSMLAGILNKAIHHTGSVGITSALMQYSSVETSFTLTDVLRQYSLIVILILMAFLALLLGSFLIYRKRTRLFNAEQARTQASLEAALEEAKVASEAKTNFLSSMSHDIRTPMNAIIGMTTIASNHLDDRERVEDCLEKISLSSHHLLTLINNVLDISKIESGKLMLNPVSFSLTDMVSAMVDIIRPQIAGKKLDFSIDTQDIPYEFIYADELRVNQVFINILTNAVKYTPEGGRIEVSLREELLSDEKQVKLIYTVKDNGIGMSREFMDNMYENFTRANDSRIDKIQGTGLGLSIVRQIVDMMGGVIDCQSKEGQGTTFVISFDVPIKDALHRKEAIADAGEALGNRLKDMHLLIAEDNDLNWEIIKELLDMHQVSAQRAENGQICVDMLRSAAPGTYDMVLMDIQMPVMGGRDAARAIRSDEQEAIRTIPIIAMTADAFAEDVVACLEAGMDGHVSKPVDIDKLFQEIYKVFRNRNLI